VFTILLWLVKNKKIVINKNKKQRNRIAEQKPV